MVPIDEGQRLLWAASIAQTAATLFVNDPAANEDVAVDNAIELYSTVLERLNTGRELVEDDE